MHILDFIVLVDTKAKMTLKAELSKLYLSYLWWLLEPLFFVLTFYLVFDVLLGYGQKDYIVFLMCAKIPYLWFSKTVTQASGSIMAERWIISHIDISKTIFPYATIQVSLYKEWPVFLLLFALCYLSGYTPNLSWFNLIPLLILEYLLIVFCSLILALLVCYADDVRMVINMVMMLLMFVSGIFFDLSQIKHPIGSYLINYNPLAFICDSFRSVLMGTKAYSMSTYWAYVLLFSLGIVVMHFIYSKYSRVISAKVII